MTREQLTRFARRDWAQAADAKRQYWVQQYRDHGCAPARTASTALLLHMRTVQPDYPSEADREQDLTHHQSLRRQLDLAAHAFARR